MCPLSCSRRGRQSTSSGISTFAVQSLRGLECTPSKQRHPRPAAPPWQRKKCPQRPRHSGLPESKSRSDPVLFELSPLWFVSVPSREAEVEGEVSFSVSKMLGRALFGGRDFWHASVNVAWRYGHVVGSNACMLRGYLEKTGLGKKSVNAPRSPHPETYRVTLAEIFYYYYYSLGWRPSYPHLQTSMRKSE